jgi:hypothetical protein
MLEAFGVALEAFAAGARFDGDLAGPIVESRQVRRHVEVIGPAEALGANEVDGGEVVSAGGDFVCGDR